jgi:hypothetical protein
VKDFFNAHAKKKKPRNQIVIFIFSRHGLGFCEHKTNLSTAEAVVWLAGKEVLTSASLPKSSTRSLPRLAPPPFSSRFGRCSPEMAGTLAGAGIVWQTPANPPEAQDYIFRNGNQ